MPGVGESHGLVPPGTEALMPVSETEQWIYVAIAIIVIGGVLIARKLFWSRSREPAPKPEPDVLAENDAD